MAERTRNTGLEKLNIFSLVLSSILLVYTIWILFNTSDKTVIILSVAVIIYYLSVIPTQYHILGKKCYCEDFSLPKVIELS